jgi:hypothetical protein
MDLSDFPPFDESVQGRALTPDMTGSGSHSPALSGANMVRSNIFRGSVAGMLDVQIIRHDAESMRTAWIRGKLEAVWLALENWLERRRQRELEGYLADSQNLADLEARIRRYTFNRTPFGLMDRNCD